MLVNLKNILKIADAEECAIGAFNTPNLESLKSAIAAAEQLNRPVIVMHAQLHEEMGLAKLEEIGPIMLFLADKAKVPVCVHLDHGTSLAYIQKGLEIGFTSVMYDGSELDMKLNYANTSIAVELASKFGASVEAEVGSMGVRESGDSSASVYTDPDLAQDFAAQTGIDALACAFGTVHGIYAKEPKLDFDLVKEIRAKLGVPIVMHGGSGIKTEEYLRVIKCGVRKINYYTYMAKAAGTAVAEMQDKTFYHDIVLCAEQAMKEDFLKAIETFSK